MLPLSKVESQTAKFHGREATFKFLALAFSQIGLQLDLYLWFCIAIICMSSQLAELAVDIFNIQLASQLQLATSNFHHAWLIATYVASCVRSKYSINSLSYYYHSQLAFDFKEQQTFFKPRHVNCMPSSNFFKLFFLPRYFTQLAIGWV